MATLKRIWHFLWDEESVWSWIANIIVAFVLIKFIIYPGLGWVLGTPAPIVAVVSGSMEHNAPVDEWWNSSCPQEKSQAEYYAQYDISQESFRTFSFMQGFDKGDIMVLFSPKTVEVGDVLVYRVQHRPDPIIHRVVAKQQTEKGIVYKTKGDHNCGVADFEQAVPEQNAIGKAVLRVPVLGWVKIIFVRLLQLIGLWRGM